MKEAQIHAFNVPFETKGRWIRASRARGMRLNEWIIEAAEAQLKKDLDEAVSRKDQNKRLNDG